MFNKYPYTDFHELNLDWVIAKIKYIEQASHIIYDNSGTGLVANNVQDAINEIYNIIQDTGVVSFNGRVGEVVPEAGDYLANMIAYSNTVSGLTATEAQGAIDELKNMIDTTAGLIPTVYVESFNGRTAAVLPASGDYTAAQIDFDNTGTSFVSTNVEDAIKESITFVPSNIVESFATRTGSVTPTAGDYTAAQITYDNTVSGIPSTDVQDAIDRIATQGIDADHIIYDNTISGLTATDVQAAIDEVANDVLSSGVASFKGRTGAVNPAAHDYDADQVDYDNSVSGLTATDVNSAIDELAAAVPPTPALGDLTNVTLTTPSNGQVLTYDSANSIWVNATPASGGLLPHLIVSAAPGETVTAVIGLTTITLTETSSGTYEANLPSYGTYTISDGIDSTLIAVDTVKIYNVTLGTIPDGSTVTPTDDVGIWQRCAGLAPTYTTIAQILADSATLAALISDSNAMDYLVRSTTFAADICGDSGAMTDIGADNYAANTLIANLTWLTAIANSAYIESVMNVKVPTMTGPTTPSGEALSNSEFSANAAAWKSYDGDNETLWASARISGEVYNTYQWASPTKALVAKLFPNAEGDLRIKTVRIEGSNNNSTWTSLATDVYTSQADVSWHTYVLNNAAAYTYYKVSCPDAFSTDLARGFYTIQYYGRTDV